MVDFSTVICWMNRFVFLGVSGLFCRFNSIFCWKILLANTVDPYQTPHTMASDLGLHCLPIYLFRVSRKGQGKTIIDRDSVNVSYSLELLCYR